MRSSGYETILNLKTAKALGLDVPPSLPHSIQGLNPDGCEFLLVFDDGDFDEDNTFLISDWFKHTPNEVLAKNFGARRLPRQRTTVYGVPPEGQRAASFRAPPLLATQSATSP